MIEELAKIRRSALEAAANATSADAVESLRIQYLGRKGALTVLLRSIKDLPLEERRVIGKTANDLREEIAAALTKKEEELKRSMAETILKKEWVDVTRPGAKAGRGHLHPVTKLLRDIEAIFGSMGFAVAEGPEVETEYYNFDALNIPAHHPARDMWDTLWIKSSRVAGAKGGRLLLRAHTSPVQIRYMETHNPPIRIIAPGRVWRHEATDAAHEIQFHQLEGLMVDRQISIANFKAVIQNFFSRLFGEAVEIRLVPSYYPFTEPSFDVAMRSRHWPEWLEAAGAGMVHPKVFEAVGYNPKEVQGFAFGMGIERLAMMKYKIPDIRLFHSGDLRFLQQF